MELEEAVRRRRMCRSFAGRPVDAGLVDILLDRARRAPSAGHTQGWAFLVLEGAGQTGPFWSAVSGPEWLDDPEPAGLVRAPVVIVPYCSPAAYLDRYSEPDKVAFGLGSSTERWPAPFWVVDVSFAVMTILLSVTDLGLGALFFGLKAPGAPERLREGFGVPAGWDPIGAVALGWPDGDGGPRGSAATRPRRTLDEVVHRGRW